MFYSFIRYLVSLYASLLCNSVVTHIYFTVLCYIWVHYVLQFYTISGFTICQFAMQFCSYTHLFYILCYIWVHYVLQFYTISGFTICQFAMQFCSYTHLFYSFMPCWFHDMPVRTVCMYDYSYATDKCYNSQHITTHSRFLHIAIWTVFIQISGNV